MQKRKIYVVKHIRTKEADFKNVSIIALNTKPDECTTTKKHILKILNNAL